MSAYIYMRMHAPREHSTTAAAIHGRCSVLLVRSRLATVLATLVLSSDKCVSSRYQRWYLLLVLAQLDRRVLRGLVLAARVGVAAAALAVALAAGRNEAVREAELVCERGASGWVSGWLVVACVECVGWVSGVHGFEACTSRITSSTVL